ncbi:MAG: alpha/beta hydrolase [Candidatus Omnitrophica bacterium]|nr:alpha/beta hydrolase [Candidatus Omnitrophota bacterium]MDD5546535.1 alpha/beta hydrolase [Candidatus Omnitrophota bacterium]
MDNLRKYGDPPFRIAVIHGGPGGAGEVAPVARELSSKYGVLEPLQTAMSVDGQVEELKSLLENNASLPVILIGYSWGAWLSLILAAKHPALVKKLILVGSGPFEEKYAAQISKARLDRMDKEIVPDAYDPIEGLSEEVDFRVDIFESVWKEASELRRSGKLLEFVKDIRCPVVAIHGDYDPHPAEGVQKPLSAILNNFRFILLDHCGHKPWIEKDAREKFFELLKNELN